MRKKIEPGSGQPWFQNNSPVWFQFLLTPDSDQSKEPFPLMARSQNKKNRKNQRSLRKIIRVRDEFTCQNPKCGNPRPCPVVDRCYLTPDNDPLIKGFCSFPVKGLNPRSDRFQGFRKCQCPLEVHHHSLSAGECREQNLSLNEEAAACKLLCSACHKLQHLDKPKHKNENHQHRNQLLRQLGMIN